MTYRNIKPRDPGAILMPRQQGPGPREQHLFVDKRAPGLSCDPSVGVLSFLMGRGLKGTLII